MLDNLRQRARALKRDTYALYLAARSPHTPWYARLLAIAVVAYALSPLDLIPDFIPIIGYLDDLILVPLGIALALRLIPPDVMEASRAQATEILERGALSRSTPARVATVLIIAVWLVLAALAAYWLWRAFAGR